MLMPVPPEFEEASAGLSVEQEQRQRGPVAIAAA
jgi:hypothetical protein